MDYLSILYWENYANLIGLFEKLRAVIEHMMGATFKGGHLSSLASAIRMIEARIPTSHPLHNTIRLLALANLRYHWLPSV